MQMYLPRRMCYENAPCLALASPVRQLLTRGVRIVAELEKETTGDRDVKLSSSTAVRTMIADMDMKVRLGWKGIP